MDRLAFAALCLLTFLIPWDNTVSLPGLGSLAQLAGASALGLCVLDILLSGRFRRVHAVHVFAAAFLLWSAVSLAWTASLDATLARTLTYAQVIILAWLIWQQARTPFRQNMLLACYVLGAFVPALDTINHYFAGVSINPATARYSASGFNANEVAIILVLGIPMASYLAVLATRQIYGWIMALYVLVAVIATLLTGSRGALVAVPFSLLLIPWSLLRISLRAKLGVVGVLFALIWLVGTLVPRATWERLGQTQDQIVEGNFSKRGAIWTTALQFFLEYPVAGLGAGAFEQASESIGRGRLPPHQTFLSILSGQGVVGLALFVGMFVVALSGIRGMPDLQRRFWIILAITLGIGLVPRDWDFRKPTWFVLGLLTAQGALTRRDRSASQMPARAFSSRQPLPQIASMGDSKFDGMRPRPS